MAEQQSVQETQDVITNLLGTAGAMLQQDFVIPQYTGTSTKQAETDVGMARRSQKNLRSVGKESLAKYNVAEEELKAAEEAKGKAGSDTAFADQAQQEILAKNARYTNELFNLTGENSTSVANLVKTKSQLTNEIVAKKPVLDKELGDIQEMQKVGPFDDPLQWLFNGLQLPSKISAYNTEAAKLNNTADQAEIVQKHIDDGLKNSKDFNTQIDRGNPTISVAQARATSDKAIAEANRLKAAADIAASIHMLDVAHKETASELAMAGRTIEMTGLQIRENENVYKAKIAEIQLEENKALRNLKAVDAFEKQLDLKQQQLLLDKAGQYLGYEPGTLTVAGMKYAPKNVKEDIISIGWSGNFGTTPLTAIETANNVKLGEGASPDAIKVVSYVQDKFRGVLKARTGNILESYQKLSTEEKKIKDSAELTQAIKAEMTTPDTPNNFFRALSPSQMLLDKDFAQSEIGKIIAPLANKPGDVPVTEIVNTLMIAANKNPSNAGVAISSYFKDNILKRNNVIPLRKAGGMDIDNTYVVTFGGELFDLTKSGDATKFAILNSTQRETPLPNFMLSNRTLRTRASMNVDEELLTKPTGK